jgi:GNAT superfamily N-acetyltransferase
MSTKARQPRPPAQRVPTRRDMTAVLVVNYTADCLALFARTKSIMDTERSASAPQVIREAAHDSPEYWATVDLRSSILRKPIGLQYLPGELEEEKNARHIVCYRGSTLVGCLMLSPRDGGDIQMRQVAVVPELQRHGIGRALVDFSEAWARNAGYRRMILHARETAVAFYENLAYSKVGDRFVEVTIHHWVMEKRLTDVCTP